MNTPELNPRLSAHEAIQKLNKLLQEGTLEDFEMNIIITLANRSRGETSINDVSRKDKASTEDASTKKIEKQEQDTKITTESIINTLKAGEIHYAVYGTNGKYATHEVQYTSFDVGKSKLTPSLFDSYSRIPEELRDDEDKLWVKLERYPEFKNHQVLTLRVADRRVDHRNCSHTTVAIFLDNDTQREDIEELAKDAEGLKGVMGTILEKAKSPLKGAELGVTKSFLV